MDSISVTTVDEYLCRPETGADWRAEVESFADENGIDAAWFVGMGAVRDAELWYYDQDDYEYYPVEFDEHLEVSACVGNVGWLDREEQRSSGDRTESDKGERFAHTHAVLGREDGETLSGHLNAGTVFAGEIYLREFDGELVREHDEATKLDLWL
jgi:predicted DNA-binding protein with PD1-like motif